MALSNASIGSEIFLQDEYLSLGINSSGTLGTSSNAPAGIFTDAVNGYVRLGMVGDPDGFGVGKPQTRDVMLAGTPIEGFSVGYNIGATKYVNTNDERDGISQIKGSTTNLSSSALDRAEWAGATNQGVKVDQVITLADNAKYVRVDVTLTNDSGSALSDLRYMRTIDPDQGPTFNTINTIVQQGGDHTGGALIAAYASANTNPFFYYTPDERAIVSAYGFEGNSPYDPTAFSSPQATGYSKNADTDVNIDFGLGSLAAGASTTITFYMGVTNDLTGTVAAINAASPPPPPPVNTPPVAVADALTTAAGVAASGNVLANDTDAQGDTLHAALKAGPAHGSVTLADNGAFKYTPAAGFSGTDTFTYTASDGQAASNPATVTITVTPPPNTPPVAVADALTTAAGVAASGNVLTNDTDAQGDTLHAALKAGPAHGSVTLADDGAFKYTPAAGFSGTDTFTYTASDGQAASNPATVTITVTPPPNTPPVAVADALTTAAGVAASGNVLANDTDAQGDTLHAALKAGPAHGSVTLADDGAFKYTPAAGFSGTDTFTYTASDGQAASNPATVTITVTPPPNTPPVAVADALTTAAGVAASGNVLANDTDAQGDTLHAALKAGPAHGSVTLADDGAFKYTPAAGFSGTDTFTYTASDGQAASNPATVTITVTPPPNTPPVAVADALTTAAGVAASGNVLANDTDAQGDTLHAALKAGPAHGSVTLADDGAFKYTPAAGFSGTDTFTYTASDGQAASNPATVTITVTPPPNTPPVVTSPPPPPPPVVSPPDPSQGSDIQISTQRNQIYDGAQGHMTFSVAVDGHSGSNTVTNFGHEDALVTSIKLYDGNNDGVVTFKNNMLSLDGPHGSETLKLPAVSSLRYLGQDSSGHYTYGNATVRPSHAIEGTLGNDTLSGDAAGKIGQAFFYDTGLHLGLGSDTIADFSGKDTLVTTSPLALDPSGHVDLNTGSLSLTDATGASLGHVALTDLAGHALSALQYDGHVSHGGVDYYVYGVLGTPVGVGGLTFG